MQDSRTDLPVPQTSSPQTLHPNPHASHNQRDSDEKVSDSNVSHGERDSDTTLGGKGGERSSDQEVIDVANGEKSKDGGAGRTSVEELTEEEQEDGSNHVTGAKLGLLSFGLCVALFVVALDNTIIGKSHASCCLTI